jgi:hypothetical protein
MARPEAVLQAHVMRAIAALPHTVILRNYVAKIPSPWGPGKIECGLGVGSPDLVGATITTHHCVCGRAYRHGVPLGIELKVPGEKADPHQAVVHEAWRDAGWLVETVTSVEQAVEMMARLGVRS